MSASSSVVLAPALVPTHPPAGRGAARAAAEAEVARILLDASAPQPLARPRTLSLESLSELASLAEPAVDASGGAADASAGGGSDANDALAADGLMAVAQHSLARRAAARGDGNDGRMRSLTAACDLSLSDGDGVQSDDAVGEGDSGDDGSGTDTRAEEGRGRRRRMSFAEARRRAYSLDVLQHRDGGGGFRGGGCSAGVLANMPGFTVPECAGGGRRVGAYEPEERAALLERFHAKRARRVWRKKIRYSCRKSLADRRVRVKGRFIKSGALPPVPPAARAAAAAKKRPRPRANSEADARPYAPVRRPLASRSRRRASPVADG